MKITHVTYTPLPEPKPFGKVVVTLTIDSAAELYDITKYLGQRDNLGGSNYTYPLFCHLAGICENLGIPSDVSQLLH